MSELEKSGTGSSRTQNPCRRLARRAIECRCRLCLGPCPAKENEKSMKYVLVSALFLVTLFAWAGEEPWKSKPYRRWTEQDVAEVLQASPWAKTVRATGAWRPMNNGPVLLIWQDPHVGTTQADNAVHPQELPLYTILWASSRTVRAALARRAVLRGTMKEEAAQQDTRSCCITQDKPLK